MVLAIFITVAIVLMILGFVLKNGAYSLMAVIFWLMTLAFAGVNYNDWFVDAKTTWVIDSLVFGGLAFLSALESWGTSRSNKKLRIEREREARKLKPKPAGYTYGEEEEEDED